MISLRFITRQKQRRIRNVFRPANSVPRSEIIQTLLAFLGRTLRSSHWSVGGSGRQAVDVDSVLGVIDGHLLGHADDLA